MKLEGHFSANQRLFSDSAEEVHLQIHFTYFDTVATEKVMTVAQNLILRKYTVKTEKVSRDIV